MQVLETQPLSITSALLEGLDSDVGLALTHSQLRGGTHSERVTDLHGKEKDRQQITTGRGVKFQLCRAMTRAHLDVSLQFTQEEPSLSACETWRPHALMWAGSCHSTANDTLIKSPGIWQDLLLSSLLNMLLSLSDLSAPLRRLDACVEGRLRTPSKAIISALSLSLEPTSYWAASSQLLLGLCYCTCILPYLFK